jgi:hypothetical protein
LTFLDSSFRDTIRTRIDGQDQHLQRNKHQDQDPGQELADNMAAHGDSNLGHTLSRRMNSEDEEQFDVDMTIQDFLTYKATESLFEWRESSNPYQSDLPDALLTMTSGTSLILQIFFQAVLCHIHLDGNWQ